MRRNCIAVTNYALLPVASRDWFFFYLPKKSFRLPCAVITTDVVKFTVLDSALERIAADFNIGSCVNRVRNVLMESPSNTTFISEFRQIKSNLDNVKFLLYRAGV